MSTKNSDVEDYYGYWQLYPNNTRTRRWFQQFEGLKYGRPFCMRMIAALTIAYHMVYYTYQFSVVSPEQRHDLKYVIWLKRKLPFFASIGIPYKKEIVNGIEESS